ncbi:MAG: hypothetical protein K2M48_00315, partial [Clostridiales bacterium]|nr:hypothetical protein [Clostridiales bacterium]
VLNTAAADLDRGSATDAQADRTANAACQKLLRYSDEVESAQIRRALEKAGEYSVPTASTLKSYLRYVAVRALILIGEA